MHTTATDADRDTALRRWAAALLLTAAVTQLIGQAWLRSSGATAPPSAADEGGMSATWTATHVVLVASALALIGAVALLVAIVGPGPGTWLGGVLFGTGQAMALAVLGIDLLGPAGDPRLVRTLDTWDFLAVIGLVVLLLELRRRGQVVGPGADLALLGLAVPSINGLVLAAAALVLVGFAALAYDLVRPRSQVAPRWLALLVAVAYVAAGTLSWQRAALAVVVLAWTVHHIRTGTSRRSSDAVRRTPPGSRRSPARRP